MAASPVRIGGSNLIPILMMLACWAREIFSHGTALPAAFWVALLFGLAFIATAAASILTPF